MQSTKVLEKNWNESILAAFAGLVLGGGGREGCGRQAAIDKKPGVLAGLGVLMRFDVKSICNMAKAC